MTTNALAAALSRVKIDTGSITCLGCGYEHNCGIHGCAIMGAAAERLKLLQAERDAMHEQLAAIADCSTCKHVDACSEGRRPHRLCSIGQEWEWRGLNG